MGRIYMPADLLTVAKSGGRFADIHTKTSGRNEGMFLLANILIVTKSGSRFAEFYQICWQKCGGPVFLLADLWTFTNFTGQFTECHQICQQICWLSWNLPTEFRGCFCHQIYLLSLNLLADLLTLTHQICWQIYWHLHQICQQKYKVFLPAGLLTVTTSASIWLPKSAGKFADFHQICWQIYLLSHQTSGGDYFYCQIYWLSVNLPAEILPPHFCQQIWWNSANLPADLVTVSKSAGRFGDSQYICQQKYPLISGDRIGESQ